MSVRSATLIACGVLAACGGPRGSNGAGEMAAPVAEPAEPVDETAAETSEVTFAVVADEVEAWAIAGGQMTTRVLLDPATTGNDDASITLVELQEEVEALLPSSRGAATLAYVIEGGGTFHDQDRGLNRQFKEGDAAVAPAGVPLGVRASEPSLVLVAFAPAGPEARYLRGQAQEDPTDDGEGDIVVISAEEAASYVIARGRGEVMIYADEASVGDDTASLGLLTAGPGMAVPAHTHDDASEYLYLLSGRGRMRAADETFEVRAGMGVQVPRGVEHAFEVEGDEAVRAVQIYAPAGPEQRFKIE